MKTYKISSKEIAIVNEARQEEINASSFYMYLAFCLGNAGYIHAADWAWGESKNERNHFKKLSDYLQLRGVEPEVPTIPEPHIAFKDLKSIVLASDKEVELTEMYDEWLDDLKKIPSSNLTANEFMEMLNIQKWSVKEMRELSKQLEALDSKEDMIEFDKSYFGGSKSENAPM